MKLQLWFLGCVCWACWPTGQTMASPQTESITITAVVGDSDDTAQDSEESKEESTQDKANPQQRKAIRLRFDKSPIVLMRRMSLTKDASDALSRAAGSSDAANEAAEVGPPKIWLGIGLKEVEGDLATYLGSSEGVFVENVYPNSPAEAAHLQTGDLILEFNGMKVAGPAELVDVLRTIQAIPSDVKADDKAADNKAAEEKPADNKPADKVSKPATFPPVTLTLLRRGRELKVELTPAQRPSLPQPALQDDDKFTEGADIFKFGQPSELGLNLVTPFAQAIAQTKSHAMIVVKEDGKETKVSIERDGEGPAKITVSDGNEQREVTEQQLSALPEKVQQAVQQALKATEPKELRPSPGASKKGNAKGAAKSVDTDQAFAEVQEQIEKAMKQVGGGKIDIEMKNLTESLKGLGQGNVIIVDPAKLQDVHKMAQDVRKMAEDAKKSLTKQVEELQKQLKELREELESSKK